MHSKEKSGSKDPFESKKFLSRIILLEGQLMNNNYDISVIEELVVTYTVALTRNWSSFTIYSRTPLRSTSSRKSPFCCPT